MARIHLHPVGHELPHVLGPEDRERNRARMATLDAALADKVATVRAGWPEYVDRVHEKGKLTAWERIAALIDPGTEVFEVGSLVNWGREFKGSKRQAPGAGVVTVFARIHARWTVVIANDNTVASGAWWPLTPEKIERAQEMALRLRLPVVYLVDCSGLFLPEQSNSFSGLRGAGHIFTMNARLAAEGVPQIAGVFGDCIAGGGYMPIVSDRVYMTESAYMVIAGAALIKGAKALHLTSLDIGGPEVHVHQSRCADERVPDDLGAIRAIRDDVGRLPSSGAEFYRHGSTSEPPRFAADELSALFPSDSRHPYEVEEILARLVDGSLFHEFLPNAGREMITGVARIEGLWVGLIANRQGLVDGRPGGALYREGIAKISAFARACDEDGLPLVWLQDISGFDIGVEAERVGLLGYGSNLIYANSTHRAPFFTVLLRKASGAGYYAMSGLPYEPVVQLATPLTRLAVMEGRTLAIATYNSKLDDDFEIASSDPAERRAIEEGMAKTAARIDADMDPIRAASVMDADEVVPVSRLRAWLAMLVEASWQSIGYRRTKNPRIWSIHDHEVLSAADTPGEPLRGDVDGDELRAPTVGVWRDGYLHKAGRAHRIVADGAWRSVVPDGTFVEHGAVLAVRGGEVAAKEDATTPSSEGGPPPGTTVVRADTDGTVYLRPDPGSPAFAAEGAEVARAATLALVEVMKTFTPVRAPAAGTLVRVLCADTGAVRAGDALFWIRTERTS